MTLRDWQTGKGCCQDSIRGQLSLHGPVLNKVPIDSPFISDRNQCTCDWVSQLTLSTGCAEEREERKGTGLRREIGKKIWETIAQDEQQCLPQVLFSFSSVGRGREKTRFPPNKRPQRSADEDTLTESRGRLSPRRKWVCVYIWVVVVGWS